MRRFGWVCVVVGMLIAAGSVFLVEEANLAARGVYAHAEHTPLWPGLMFGLGCTALGILVLAIRRPRRAGRPSHTDDDDEPGPISFRKGRPR